MLASLAAAAAFAAAVAITTFAPPARAQLTPDQRAVFDRGLARYDAGDLGGAIGIWERLVESVGEQRAYKVLFNLGLAYQKTGDATHAIERFEAFARRASGRADAAQAVAEANESVRALKASHGAVNVLASKSGGVVMTRVGSGEPRAAGYTVWLAPGERDIEVRTGTPSAIRVKVNVTAGTSVDVETDLPEEKPPAPPPPPPSAPTSTSKPPIVEPPPPSPPVSPPPRSNFPTAWIIAGAAATLASASLPIALGARAGSKRSTAEQLGAGNTGYAQAVSDFESARTLYYASYAVPGIFAAATATLVVVSISGGGSRVAVSASLDGTLWAVGRF